MVVTEPRAEVYRFDDFTVDVCNRELRCRGALLPLTSKYFDVLVFLLRRRGQLVTKQEIFDTIWAGVFVTDAALTQCVKDIRKQLGDDAASPRYVKTIPKHGYVFVGDASEGAARAPAAPERRPFKFLDYYGEEDAPFFFGR